MTWKDQVAPVTFRGVPFFLGSTEHQGGRRTVVHEYPQKDSPWGEDLGLKAKKFTLEGYVIGDDYIAKRDALLDALDQPGSGELIHPFYGTVRVQLEGEYRVRESTQDGGMASFSIPFVVTPAKPAQPTSVVDGAATLQASAATARDAIGVEFTSTYAPGIKMAGPIAAFTAGLSFLSATLGASTADAQQLAALSFQIRTMTNTASTLAAAGAGVVSAWVSAIALVDSLSILLGLYAFNPGLRPVATTPSRLVEQTNFDSMQRLIQRLAVARACEVLSVTSFAVYEDAVTARTSVTDLLDDQAENAADDTFPVLLQLRADLVKAVPGDSKDLPRLVEYTPPQTVPSIVLAHRIYGDLSLEQEILNRNKIASPAFVRGGETLQVLSNE